MAKYQYTIKCQIKNGKPFYVSTFDYFDVCMITLNNFIKKDKHYSRPYYVYNSFFKNEFPVDFAKSKYTVLVRNVGEWVDYTSLDIFNNL